MAKANNKVSASKHPEAVPADSKKNDPAGGAPEVGDSASVAAQEPAEHDSVLDESQVDPSALIGDGVDSHSVIVTASVAAQTQRQDNTSGTPEASSMLTEDRLLDQKKTAEVPEGFFQRLLYELSFHLINVGDSRAARARKDLSSRIARPFDGGAMYVPVLTRKGGVGKTTVTTLLGMALAEVRDDRVIAIDANPDRGTLSERVPRSTAATVRDVVKLIAGIRGFTDFSELVSKDKTRLHVLASDTDPQLSEAFDEDDYNVVADAAARFYSVILTDCGTGVVHSVMKPTLERADGLVVVSGGSIDEARLASETLTWLEANGWGDLVRNTIVVLNTATQGTNVVKLEEIEDHFLSRVRDVVRIPYDPMLAAGSIIEWDRLSPFTRLAARELAALVVEGVADQSGR
ncbi:MinD-like ATPase [Pontimonas salivibrio]|uniref:MinD-like ATPase n=1 Tax=Pontimonas salivibrio TaxID=1159327 RepID=A0A2L2BQJ2_9MICO|nr:MinD/ParA family protein [Pontimonas salivibrio]AVG23930.1 MinD-like ATPase [Pontimonas salivibrio]